MKHGARAGSPHASPFCPSTNEHTTRACKLQGHIDSTHVCTQAVRTCACALVQQSWTLRSNPRCTSKTVQNQMWHPFEICRIIRLKTEKLIPDSDSACPIMHIKHNLQDILSPKPTKDKSETSPRQVRDIGGAGVGKIRAWTFSRFGAQFGRPFYFLKPFHPTGGCPGIGWLRSQFPDIPLVGWKGLRV